MAISFANKTANYASSPGGAITTASVSFTSGKVYLLTLTGLTFATDWASATLTPSGTGTWTRQTFVGNPNQTHRGITVWRYSSAGATGTVTVTLSGDNFSEAAWSIDEITGSDTGGTNGANIVVQSATGTTDLGVTSLTVTLGSFSSVNNATWGGFGSSGATGHTAGSGFTQYGNAARILTEATTGNDTTVDMSWTSDNYCAGIALEIASASVGSTASNVLPDWRRPARRRRTTRRNYRRT